VKVVAFSVTPKLVKRFGAIIMVVNIVVAFLSFTDMYLLATGAIKVEHPGSDDFDTSYDLRSMEFVFKSKFKVTNKGFYDVKDLDIESKLTTESGDVLIDYDHPDLTVPRWSSRTFEIEARMPVEKLLDLDLEDVLLNSVTLRLRIRIGADYVMGLVHFNLDQVRHYEWEAPLGDYSDILGNGTLTAIIEDLLNGEYDAASKKIIAAVYDGFLSNGGEARIPVNDYTDLVFQQEGDILHVRVEVDGPVRITLMHFEVPIEGGVEDGGGP
jgi:hypothetical protein